jgi:hypothetical protein
MLDKPHGKLTNPSSENARDKETIWSRAIADATRDPKQVNASRRQWSNVDSIQNSIDETIGLSIWNFVHNN